MTAAVWRVGPVRVRQPGDGHLQPATRPEVEDWSWRRTVRRVSTLARLTRAATSGARRSRSSRCSRRRSTALAPPLLAKLAIDDGIRGGDLARC